MVDPKIRLLDLAPEALAAFLKETFNVPGYRAKQVHEWLIRGAQIDEMTNLPAAFRHQLKEVAVPGGASIQRALSSNTDDTKKFLFELHDGEIGRASCRERV